MDKSELGIIQELMELLQDKMQYGEDDFNSRLGRKKPEVEVVKMEGDIPGGEMGMDDSSGMDMGDDSDSSMMEMDESPEDKLKRRLMKMRA